MKNEANEFKTYLSVLSFLIWSIRDYTWDYKTFKQWARCEEKTLLTLPDNPKNNRDKNSLIEFIQYFFFAVAVMTPSLMFCMMIFNYGHYSLLEIFMHSLKYSSIAYVAAIPFILEGWGVLLYAFAGIAIAVVIGLIMITFNSLRMFTINEDTILNVIGVICIYMPFIIYYLYRLCRFLYINIRFTKLNEEYRKQYDKITKINSNIIKENKQNKDKYNRREYELIEFPKVDSKLLKQLLASTDAFLLHNNEMRMAYFIQAVFNYGYGDTPEAIDIKAKSDSDFFQLGMDPTGCYSCVESYNKKNDLYFFDKNNNKVCIKHLFNSSVDHETKQEIVRMYIEYISRTYPKYRHSY